MIEYFATLGGVAALSVIVSEFLNKIFGVKKAWAKQLVSWIAPLGICIVGLLAQLGVFATFGNTNEVIAWVYTIVCGIGLGIASNGIYDLKNVIAVLIALIGLKQTNDESTEQVENNETTN